MPNYSNMSIRFYLGEQPNQRYCYSSSKNFMKGDGGEKLHRFLCGFIWMVKRIVVLASKLINFLTTLWGNLL